MLDLEAIKARNDERRRLRDAATPSKWKVIKPGHGQSTKYKCVQLGDNDRYTTLEMLPVDARLIAHSRTDTAPEDVDAILAEIERLRRIETAANEFRTAVASLDERQPTGLQLTLVDRKEDELFIALSQPTKE